MSKLVKSAIEVRGTSISILLGKDGDYISLTDMLKAKDGEFFISDWLRNRNTVEFPGIWESVFNPDFNYGEFAIIRSQAGLKSSQTGSCFTPLPQLICELATISKLKAIHFKNIGLQQ
jgi:hypothetical protein